MVIKSRDSIFIRHITQTIVYDIMAILTTG